jgi:hypothetical protein
VHRVGNLLACLDLAVPAVLRFFQAWRAIVPGRVCDQHISGGKLIRQKHLRAIG